MRAQEFGDRPAHTVGSEEIRAALEHHSVDKSPATRNRMLSQLSGAFGWRMQQGWITTHPIRGFISHAKEEKKRERWICQEELQRIISNVCDMNAGNYREDARCDSYLIFKAKGDKITSWPLAGWLAESVTRRAKSGGLLYRWQ